MKGKSIVFLWLVPIVVIAGYGLYEKRIMNNQANVGHAAQSEVWTNSPANEELSSEIRGSENHFFNEDMKRYQPIDYGSSNRTIQIVSINRTMVGQLVSIIGHVENRRNHPKGHVFLKVSDDTGQIDIPIFANKNIPNTHLKPGQLFRFTGVVDTFKGNLEIIPRNSNDIEPLNQEDFSFPKITEADIGKIVKFRATVQTVYRHPKGHIFTTVRVYGSDQEIKIPIFNSLDYSNDKLTHGSVVSIRGKVSMYEGTLQVVPDKQGDIKILDPRITDSEKLISIEQISNKERGKMFQVRGYVTGVRSFGGNTFFSLHDKWGHSIKAVLFKADTAEIIGRKIKIVNAEKEKFPIRVLALVDVYKGELNLIIDKVYNQY